MNIFEKFDAMKKELSEDLRTWQEIDEKSFEYMLNVLPPKRMNNGGFVLCEAYTDLENGETIYSLFIKWNKKYYTTYGTIHEWDNRLIHPSKPMPKLSAQMAKY